ncbi:MAG: hypothetical protein ABR543_12030 [Gemmatimonadaceae bacterium]
MNSQAEVKEPSGKVMLGLAVVWMVTYFGARELVQQGGLQTWQRVVVVLIPVLPFVLLLLQLIRGMRSLDELHKRVQLEALAIAYPLALVLLMTLGLLEVAIDLNPDDWSYKHVWPFLVTFYFGGLALAWRRYK